MNKLALVIKAKDVAMAQQEIAKASKFTIDAIELRLDCFVNINLEELMQFMKMCSLPTIFSLRSKESGGFYGGTEREHLGLIMQLLELAPDYVDLEYHVPNDFVAKIRRTYPAVKLICSYYNMEGTPGNLNSILSSIKKDGIAIHKIVTKANSSLDTLRMMNFVVAHKGRVAGICTGPLGLPTRILAKVLGSALNYAYQENDFFIVPEGLTLETLFDTYNHADSNKNTKVFSWLGASMSHSKGHIFHNRKFRENGCNAIYIKIQLQQSELTNFFELIDSLPFFGFSVTMPLKETVIPFLHELSEDARVIGAVNTILVKHHKLYGFNTDSKGALDAIEKKIRVENKTLVIIGAGGAAKAIAFEAIKRKATVFILNEIESRAKEVARQLGCKGFGLDYISKLHKEGYDILVNATPIGMDGPDQMLPIPDEKILPRSAVMDVVNKPQTPFIQASIRCGGKGPYITGYEMYINQALGQEKIWFA